MATAAIDLRPRSGDITFDDFCAIIRPEQKADLIDGVIYMASPESLESDQLNDWLRFLITEVVDSRGAGKVFGSRVAYRLSPKHAPEPDISFIQTARLHLAHKTYFDGPPDLAVEIVSPESVQRDYVVKRERYRASGVREYWIIDPMIRRLTALRLDGKKRYREVGPKDGYVASAVLDGFRLRPEWLWQDPLPRRAEILALLLS